MFHCTALEQSHPGSLSWISLCLSTAKLAAGQQKHLLFEVQPGSDATALWKVAVRVLCTKVRPLVHVSICPCLDPGGQNNPEI